MEEFLYEGQQSLIYRGCLDSSQIRYIIKLLKTEYPSPQVMVRFRQEYELLCQAQGPGVVKVEKFDNLQNHWAIVMEDFGGNALNQLVQDGSLPLVTFFPLALKICEALDQVHQQQIIHKDLNPSNIVYNPFTHQVKLIDFGLASRLSQENPRFQNPTLLEGTLPYISPEQTGRMNRMVDYRTDFYSLGITFYELLIGQRPFAADDPIGWMHMHLAHIPTSPHELCPSVPASLSQIVLKLMEKDVESRYQSVAGLKYDLIQCQQQWEATGRVGTLEIGQHDHSPHLQLPQKLYGRQHEISTLLSAFERIAQGQTEVLFVRGYSGIGKSTLIQELYKSITEACGYFITGKCDLQHRDIPYAPWIQAFRLLIQQLLAESNTQVAHWRQQLLAVLDNNGSVVADVIPELTLLIGEQPEVSDLPIMEAQNRFHRVFQQFIRIFPQPEHPLVLFLDDLQWADTASLKLLEMLATTPECRAFFILGAYRENEVHATHPLALSVEHLLKQETIVHQITLPPLTLEAVTQFVHDALTPTTYDTASLAELIFQRTGGNPFFMNLFLKSLYEKKLLWFQPEQQWQWDWDKIQTQQTTDNMIELMLPRLQQLEPNTQDVLKVGACLGQQFALDMLVMVCEQTTSAVSKALWSAVEAGIVIPLGDFFQQTFDADPTISEDANIVCAFAHDQIQQAIVSLVSETEQQTLHYRIGTFLLQGISPGESQQQIFSVVHHLNRAISQITSPAERKALAELNLQAGQKAKGAVAYDVAFHYLMTGMTLLGEDGWSHHYSLMLALTTTTAEIAYLSGNFDQLDTLLQQGLAHARNDIDKVPLYLVQIDTYSAQGQRMEAVQTALTVLEYFGISFPLTPQKAHIVFNLLKTRFLLKGRSLKGLQSLPAMENPRSLALMEILTRTFSHAYFVAPQLLPLVVFKVIELSLKHGNAPISALAYAAYGLILCGKVGDLESGYRFGELALSLMQRSSTPMLKSRILTVVHLFIRHWKAHGSDSLEAFQAAYQNGLEAGNWEYVSYAASAYCYQSFVVGMELTQFEEELASLSQTLQHLHQESAHYQLQLYRQVAWNLRHRSENSCSLEGQYYQEAQRRATFLEAEDKRALYHLSVQKLYLAFLFGNYREGLEYATSAEKYADGLVMMILMPFFYFYDSLTRLALFDAFSPSEKKYNLKKIKANQKRMKTWAWQAPMNYLHKWYLVEAEWARVEQKISVARECYDQAIVLAQKHQYLHEEALAHELAGRFYSTQDFPHLTHAYFRNAHYAYQRWGAWTKVQDLEKHYPHFVDSVSDHFREKDGVTQSPFSHSSSHESYILDWMSVKKVSEVLSGERVFAELLHNLMDIVFENAGAQKGILWLARQNQLCTAVKGTSKDIHILQAESLEDNDELPMSIIRYVERTRKELVLLDAVQSELFASDLYVRRLQPKSVLCFPMMHQTHLVGVLYLENNLTPGTFTPDRIEILQLLSTQAAVSIENASLYAQLGQSFSEESADAEPFAEPPVPMSPSPQSPDPETLFRQLLVDVMQTSLESWQQTTHTDKIELAEKSKIWRVHIDDGRLRVRAMDRYLSPEKLPKKPRWREVVRTAYYVLSHCDLDVSAKQELEMRLNHLLKQVHQRKST